MSDASRWRMLAGVSLCFATACSGSGSGTGGSGGIGGHSPGGGVAGAAAGAAGTSGAPPNGWSMPTSTTLRLSGNACAALRTASPGDVAFRFPYDAILIN